MGAIQLAPLNILTRCKEILAQVQLVALSNYPMSYIRHINLFCRKLVQTCRMKVHDAPEISLANQ